MGILMCGQTVRPGFFSQLIDLLLSLTLITLLRIPFLLLQSHSKGSIMTHGAPHPILLDRTSPHTFLMSSKRLENVSPFELFAGPPLRSIKEGKKQEAWHSIVALSEKQAFRKRHDDTRSVPFTSILSLFLRS